MEALRPDYDTLEGWKQWAEWRLNDDDDRSCFEPTPDSIADGVLHMAKALLQVSAMKGQCLLGGDSKHTGENPPRMHELGSNKAFEQAADAADRAFDPA